MRFLPFFLCFFLASTSLFAQKERKLYGGNEVLRFDNNDSTQKVEPIKEIENNETNNANNATPTSSATEVIPNDNEHVDTQIIRKDVYKVALILPFNAGAGWGAMNKGITMIRDSSAKKASIPRETKISIDLYNGFRMAIAEATKSTIKIEFYVYDDQKNEDQTKKLLEDSMMKKMDIIIGPAHTQNAILVAEFCKQNKIYNFSPLSPSIYIATANPYHFKLNPSIEMLCKAAVDKLVNEYEYGSVLLLGRATDDDRHYASVVYDYVAALNKNREANKKLFCDTLISGNESNKKSLSSMYSGKHNVVICPSFNESFISGACGRVSSSSNVSFYGMPTWLDYDAVNYNTMNGSRPFIPKISFADTSDSRDKFLLRSFSENHGYPMEENTMLGYDIMKFTIYALETYGISLKENADKLYYEGQFTRFKFVPVKYSKAETGLPYDMYENCLINFPQFSNFELNQTE